VKRALMALALLALLWQSAELGWRRFAWAQEPPEVPLWACLLLLLANLVFLGWGAREIAGARRKP
jgi:hypothetical protein